MSLGLAWTVQQSLSLWGMVETVELSRKTATAASIAADTAPFVSSLAGVTV